MRFRTLQFVVPVSLRGGNLELRLALSRHEGKPSWSKEGTATQLSVNVPETATPRSIDFGLFADGHQMTHGVLELRDGQVFHCGDRVLPVLGVRSFTDVNIIPGFSRKEASVV